MSRFPLDKMPAEYDGEIVQRTLEDALSQLDGVEGLVGSLGDDLKKRIDLMGKELAVNSQFTRESRSGEQATMPIPTALETFKMVNIPFLFSVCDPIEVMKFPHVAGFQFFASPDPNFKPAIESGVTDITGCASATHLTVLTISASKNPNQPASVAGYHDMRFWSWMDLVGKGVINTTTGDTGSISAWVHTDPLKVTTDIAWTIGDDYKILDVVVPKNLIGQGPLPWAWRIIPLTWAGNNGEWDHKTIYVKARCYSRGLPRARRYGGFCTAEATSDIDATLPAPTVTAVAHYYLNYIIVRWTRGAGKWLTHVQDWDHWKLYRTPNNDTAECDDDTYVLQDDIKTNFYYDWGSASNGPTYNTTYYYWVRGIDQDGNNGALSVSDNAMLGIAADPVIDSITEQSTTGFIGTKDYDFVWTCAGGAESYQVKRRLKLNGVYGLYSLPVIVQHMTDQGVIGGEDKQIHTVHDLWVGHTYTFAVRACNNWNVTGLNSNWVTQDQAISDSVAPDAPA